MRKERKVNIIRALKQELSFYKQSSVKPMILNTTELKHLRIQQIFSMEEVMHITRLPKELRTSLIQSRIAKAVQDSIGELPVVTEFDEHYGTYRVSLDLWVKPENEEKRIWKKFTQFGIQ